MIRATPDNKLPRLTKWEYMVPALAIGSLLVSCIIVSSKKNFWIDELLTYYLCRDQSFWHMMTAFGDKFTNGPPLYFVLGWLWARVFGATELSLRLFSWLGMSIGCLLVWMTLRRTYQFWPAAIGTLGIFCGADLILVQNAESRMYGLFLGACALGMFQFDVINKGQYCSRRMLVLNGLIHAVIVQTHLFGILYSGTLLCGFILRDKYFKIVRPKVYVSIILGWLSLIPYIPTFLNQADAGNPRSWILTPDLDFLEYALPIPSASPFFSLIFVLLVVISAVQFVCVAVAGRQFPRPLQQGFSEPTAEIPLMIVGCLGLAVPAFIWIISLTIKPLFVPRYMIPSALGWCILLAYLCSRIIVHRNGELACVSRRRLRVPVLLLALTAMLLVHPISYAWSRPRGKLPGINDGRFGYENLPIVAPFSHDFIKRFHYSPDRQRYFFILDWEAAVDINSGLFPPQEYKTMDALKREYREIFHDNIIQIWDFLSTYNRFLILDYVNYQGKCTPQDFHCPRWIKMRIKNNPAYKVTALGIVDGRRLLLVEKK